MEKRASGRTDRHSHRWIKPVRHTLPLLACCLLAVCSAGNAQAQTLRGIDVSMWQGANINWAAVKQSGVSFAFVKASQNRTFTDPQYASNAQHARAAGVRVGAYDFADPSDGTHAQIIANAIADADHFLAAARPQPTDLRPVLDVETTNGLTPAELTLWVNTWAGHVDDRIHARPFIYTSPSFWQVKLANTQTTAAAADLWIAHWTTAAQPTLPANGWDGLGWSFWQYSDCTRPRGTTGCVDGDRMSGSSFLPYLIGDVPSAAVAPAVSGTVAVGRTLTASTGRWHGTRPIDLSYEWQRCDRAGAHCRDISGETGTTYRTVAADYLRRIRVRVSATNRLGQTVASSVVTAKAADLDPPSVPVVTGVDDPFRQDASFTPSWHAADALSGVATYDVQTRVLSSARAGAWADAQSAAAATTIPMAGKPGQTTCVRVRATGPGAQHEHVVSPPVHRRVVPARLVRPRRHVEAVRPRRCHPNDEGRRCRLPKTGRRRPDRHPRPRVLDLRQDRHQLRRPGAADARSAPRVRARCHYRDRCPARPSKRCASHCDADRQASRAHPLGGRASHRLTGKMTGAGSLPSGAWTSPRNRSPTLSTPPPPRAARA